MLKNLSITLYFMQQICWKNIIKILYVRIINSFGGIGSEHLIDA